MSREMKDVGRFLFAAPAFEFVLPSLEDLEGLTDFEAMRLVWRSMFGEEMPEEECTLWLAEHADGLASASRGMDVLPSLAFLGEFQISGIGDGPLKVITTRVDLGPERFFGAWSAEFSKQASGENPHQFFGSFFSARGRRGRFTA